MKTSGRCFVGYFLTVGLAFFACLESSAYGQATEDWNRVVEGARKEGKVVVFAPAGAVIRQAITEGFRKQFPDIRLEYSGARPGELATRLSAERDGGIYSVDVFVTGPTTANFQLKPIGALEPIRPALILPEVTNLEHWQEHRLAFADKEQLYNLVFVAERAPVAIYDPRQVKRQEIDALYKLLDARWKGKIVINDPLVSGAAVPFFRFIWETLGAQKATDYYRKIRAQAATVDRDTRRQVEWVAQGKYAMVIAPSASAFAQLLQKGLRFEVLEEFTDYGAHIGSSSGTVVLINKAPHPNAAAVFINWLLSKDGQLLWSKAMDHPSRRLDVPRDHLAPYKIPDPTRKYWIGYTEEAQTRKPEEEKIMKEIFGK